MKPHNGEGWPNPLDLIRKPPAAVKFWAIQYACWFGIIHAIRGAAWVTVPSAGLNHYVETAALAVVTTPVAVVCIYLGMAAFGIGLFVLWLLAHLIMLGPAIIHVCLESYLDRRRGDVTEQEGSP